jgi:hypothetical protein
MLAFTLDADVATRWICDEVYDADPPGTATLIPMTGELKVPNQQALARPVQRAKLEAEPAAPVTFPTVPGQG